MMKSITLFLCITFSLYATSIEDIKNSMDLNYAEGKITQNLNEKEYNNMIANNYQYYTNIVKKAKEYYTKYLSQKWGYKNVKLSDKKTFVQYSKDMNSREQIDFKNGKVILEQLVDINKTIKSNIFKNKLSTLMKQTYDETLKKDPILKLSNRYLKEDNYKNNSKVFKEQILAQTIVIKEKIVILDSGKNKKIVYATINMVPNHLEKRANIYKDIIIRESKKYGIKPSYIFATIQTESYFNPFAVSYAPAYGLMQLVPSTGAMDAYMSLYKQKKILSPTYLYDANNNIKLGSKYIHIIKERYLAGITDRKNLLYCTAISYNAGIGTLYKSFTGSYKKKEETIKIINEMSSEDLYTYLTSSKTFTKEARNYVKKIRTYSNNYKSWDN